MEDEIKLGFTGIWIPAEIIEDYDLTITEMFLFSYIYSLGQSKDLNGKKKGCFASNEHLSKRLKISKSLVVKSLINLRDKGLIKTVDFDGRKRFMKSLIKIGDS